MWGSNRGNLAEKVERKHKNDKEFNFCDCPEIADLLLSTGQVDPDCTDTRF